MDIATLGAAASAGALPFRSPASLAAFDAVFIDLDAVAAEYMDSIEAREPSPLFDVTTSARLLADARRWREALAEFMRAERVVLVGWTTTPNARVHTIHDVVPFGSADLFPLVAPQIEQRTKAEPVAVACGEPFNRFLAALGAPAASAFAVRALRGEPLLRFASGDAAALYVIHQASHLVFAPIAAGPDRAERVCAAIEVLGGALCGARHSTFLPAWARRAELPSERVARERLETMEQELHALRRRADAARTALDGVRRMKAIVGGSPAQATAAASEGLRIRGANLLRDFEHENGFVSGIDARTTVLFAFATPEHMGFVGRAESMLARYRYEFDGDASVLLVLLPHADGTPGDLAALTSGDHAACHASALLDALLDESASLPDRIRSLIEKSRRP